MPGAGPAPLARSGGSRTFPATSRALVRRMVELATRVRPVRLPPGDGAAAGARAGGEPQAGRAALAAGGPESAAAAAEAAAAVAERRLVRAAAAGAPGSRLELRLRRRPDAATAGPFRMLT